MRKLIIFPFTILIVLEIVNRTDAGKKKYTVNTPSCRIPELDPYDKSIAPFIFKMPRMSCSTQPPLTSIITNKAGQAMNFSHTLSLHQSNFYRYNVQKKDFRCCYKLITRNTHKSWKGELRPDDGYTFSSCIDFSAHVTFHGSEEFIWVGCWKRETPSEQPFYVNTHAFIGNKIEVQQKLHAPRKGKRKPSIMIFGIDSMSRMNLMRTMPKTVRYISQSGWYSMNGFNKMEDNTFPNLLAAFAGIRASSKDNVDCNGTETNLDKCPIIWKEFSKKGYITAYGEDDPYIGSFNYLKIGFQNQPTDYYMRPFMLAGYWNTLLKYLGSRTICNGPARVTDLILNYARDFSTSFLNYPTFSLFWLNNFSHDYLNGPSMMDGSVLSFLRKLKSSGVMNNTIIVFMSDHGMRFGSIRRTFVGYLEERLPFLYFRVPRRFEKAHPVKIRNLAHNRYKLISPFDLYMTLADLLGKDLKAPGCPKCSSLFGAVPWNRSCNDAGILDHWCACAEFTNIPTTHPLAVDIAESVVNHINTILGQYAGYVSKGSHCAKLKNYVVISLRKKISSEQHKPQMIVVVQTTPGNGVFESTVSYEDGSKVIGDVSRLNVYGNQSACVKHYVARKYCYCEKGDAKW